MDGETSSSQLQRLVVFTYITLSCVTHFQIVCCMKWGCRSQKKQLSIYSKPRANSYLLKSRLCSLCQSKSQSRVTNATEIRRDAEPSLQMTTNTQDNTLQEPPRSLPGVEICPHIKLLPASPPTKTVWNEVHDPGIFCLLCVCLHHFIYTKLHILDWQLSLCFLFSLKIV